MLTGRLYKILVKLAEYSKESTDLNSHYTKLSKLLMKAKYKRALQLIEQTKEQFINTSYYDELANMQELFYPSETEMQQHQLNLFNAIQQNDLEEVAEVLGNGAITVISKAYKKSKEPTQFPIVEAFNISCEAMMFFLIKHGALCEFPISQPVDSDHNTLLHLASALNFHRIVALLLEECNININKKNNQGDTALDLAFDLKYKETVRTIINFAEKWPLLLNKEQTLKYKILLPESFKALKSMMKISIMQSGSLFKHLPEQAIRKLDMNFKAICQEVYIQDSSSPEFIYIDMLQAYKKSKMLRPFYTLLALAMQGNLPGRNKPLKVIINNRSDITDLVFNSCRLTEGAYTNKNTLFIAGKQKSTASAIAHEAIHYIARHIDFEADSNTFNEAYLEFKMRYNEYSKKDDLTEIDTLLLDHFSPVFESDYDDYRAEELMARMGEVLYLLDIEEGSRWLERNAPKLFSIFKNEFLHACELYLQKHKLLDIKEESTEILPNSRLFN